MVEGSFPEDSGTQDRVASAAGSGGAAEVLAGQGFSDDGSIRATVSDQGRVDGLDLSRRIPGSQDGGPVDAETLAREVTTAVNAALDDLADKRRAGSSDGFDSLEAKLDEVTAGFERALGKVADDLAQAQKRLEET